MGLSVVSQLSARGHRSEGSEARTASRLCLMEVIRMISKRCGTLTGEALFIGRKSASKGDRAFRIEACEACFGPGEWPPSCVIRLAGHASHAVSSGHGSRHGDCSFDERRGSVCRLTHKSRRVQVTQGLGIAAHLQRREERGAV